MKLVIVSLEAGSGQINHYSTLGQIAGLEEGLNGGYGPTQLPAIHNVIWTICIGNKVRQVMGE